MLFTEVCDMGAVALVILTDTCRWRHMICKDSICHLTKIIRFTLKTYNISKQRHVVSSQGVEVTLRSHLIT